MVAAGQSINLDEKDRQAAGGGESSFYCYHFRTYDLFTICMDGLQSRRHIHSNNNTYYPHFSTKSTNDAVFQHNSDLLIIFIVTVYGYFLLMFWVT